MDIKKLYEGNQCEHSLFYFSQKNPIRIFLYKIAKSNRFELFITVILLVSTLQQILETYYKADEKFIQASDNIDLTISLIYIIEMIIKVLALGFIMEKGTYLSDNWNKLDFFVMIVTIIDVGNKIDFLITDSKIEGLEFFNILKLLRNLRTFRILSKTDQMKKIIGSLLDSLNSILKILGIVFIVFIIMSIIGINLFYPKYNTCYVKNDSDQNQPILNFTATIKANNLSLDNAELINQFVSFNSNRIV